jgi:hypothetical protein
VRRFSGGYALVEVRHRLWRYYPDPNQPLTYDDGRVYITLDQSFETDGASIPRIFWSVPGFDPMDWPKAALLHDWLWEEHRRGGAIGFHGSNRLLYNAIRTVGWNRLVACLCWIGVTLFGWIIWRRK